MKTPVIWYGAPRMACSCMTIVNEWLETIDCDHMETFPEADGPVIVVIHGGLLGVELPDGGLQAALTLREKTERYDHVLYISVADEANGFHYNLLPFLGQQNKLWLQLPKPGKVKADRYFVAGYHSDIHEAAERLKKEITNRDLNWAFAGQITHQRREECASVLRSMEGGALVETNGFQRGLPHGDYYRLLSRAKIVPCPSGFPATDSFRFCEALELGAIPVIDSHAPDGVMGYWNLTLGDHPFFVIDDWSGFPQVVEDILRDYDYEKRLTEYWWKAHKLKMRSWLQKDLKEWRNAR